MNEPLPCSLPSPEALAFLGDSVYGTLVRARLATRFSHHGELHCATLSYVTAKAQATAYRVIFPLLSEYERALCRRAYNGGHKNKPKHTKAEDYGCATALEALFGMLYLTENRTRLTELFTHCLAAVEKISDTKSKAKKEETV